jgi:hypothetical protein
MAWRELAPDFSRTARVRRDGLTFAPFVAPWGIVVAHAVYVWMTQHGSNDLTSRNALALAAAHSGSQVRGAVADSWLLDHQVR